MCVLYISTTVTQQLEEMIRIDDAMRKCCHDSWTLICCSKHISTHSKTLTLVGCYLAIGHNCADSNILQFPT